MNARTGEVATLLFVHCGDARLLRGHFPPRCYPSQGKILVATEERDWNLGRAVIGGTRYRFTAGDPMTRNDIVVDNFMLLPDGRVERDMRSMNSVVEDVHLRRLGAAQVQVLTLASMSEERRDEVLRTLLAETAPLFSSVGAGGHP